MFRNNYDNDSVTFSPQGRIFQVEYAQEAVKQGSVVVGVVSKTHAVLAAIKVRKMKPHTADPPILTTMVAKCRRALFVPEEDHSDRLPLRSRSCRSRLRCPRPLKLYEAAVSLITLDLRPCNSPI